MCLLKFNDENAPNFITHTFIFIQYIQALIRQQQRQRINWNEYELYSMT